MAIDFDWNRLRGFLAAAEHGSLVSAARELRTTQPTLSRSIQALEEELGVVLFHRTPRGLVLTDTGSKLLERARSVSVAANDFGLAAEGRSDRLDGVVRITASEVFANYRLPNILARFRQSEPDIEIELVASNDELSLLRREADIAIRMYQPSQSELIARRVGEVELGAFASEAYLKRKATPVTTDNILEHEFIGYDRNDELIRGFHDAGLDIDRRFFKLRCENQVVCWQLVLAGAGIGFTQKQIGMNDPRVVPVLESHPMPSLPIWIAANPELKSSARIRRAYDFLADAISESVGLP